MESIDHILEFDRIREKLSEQASSELGAELALKITPIGDRDVLQQILTQTSELRDLLDYDESVPIHGIVDIRPAIQKARIAASMLEPDELSAIGQTLSVVRRLVNYFAAQQEKIPNLKKLISRFIALPGVEQEIFRVIDRQTGEVRDDASPELARIRKRIFRSHEEARTKIQNLLKHLSSKGYLQENLISMRNGRYVLVVKEEFKRRVRGLVHDQSATGSSLFIEPLETLEINNRIRELQGKEQKEIQRILQALTDVIRHVLREIEENIDCLARLDLLYARAGLSKNLNAHQPELSDERVISIAQGRHPLLLLRLDEKKVVPLDVELGRGIRTLILSGPNAGGKTVALKTIGLLTLMAQCGLHIPAQPHSVIGDIRQIFASIGDQQSIENDLSTFSSHVQNLKEIAEKADQHSLVLVDEIGAGTDPEEGSALAMAFLEHVTQIGCLTVVTTHQSVLKAFAYEMDGVENASMEFDVSSLMPTYRFRSGIPGSSYAFEIARRIGLPVPLIEKARSLVGKNKDKLEGLILDLDARMQQASELSRKLNIKDAELRGLTKLYREHLQRIRAEEKKMKTQAAQEAQAIIARANATVERVIKEIKEQQARRETIRKVKSTLKREREEIERIKGAAPEPEAKVAGGDDEPVRPGDTVKWEKFGQTGLVVSEPDKNGYILLQTDHARISVPIGDLKKIARQKRPARGFVKVNIERPDVIKTEIDLRGLTVDEARQQVDRFLDEAILSGLSEVRIIHGKGTGKLRSKINEYLRHHPAVKSARLGNWNEGDTGVTVVELSDK